MQTIKPTTGILFCKPEEAEQVTNSGFLLAKASERPLIAEVINVGTDVKGINSKDRIVYKAYATSEIKLDGVEYFLISAEDVLGTVID